MVSTTGPSRRLADPHRLTFAKAKADVMASSTDITRIRALFTLLRPHAEHPYQRVQLHPQTSNVIDLPVERLIVRAEDEAD